MIAKQCEGHRGDGAKLILTSLLQACIADVCEVHCMVMTHALNNEQLAGVEGQLVRFLR